MLCPSDEWIHWKAEGWNSGASQGNAAGNVVHRSLQIAQLRLAIEQSVAAPNHRLAVERLRGPSQGHARPDAGRVGVVPCRRGGAKTSAGFRIECMAAVLDFRKCSEVIVPAQLDTRSTGTRLCDDEAVKVSLVIGLDYGGLCRGLKDIMKQSNRSRMVKRPQPTMAVLQVILLAFQAGISYAQVKTVAERLGYPPNSRTLGGHPKPAIGGHLKTGQRDS
jgi:hypothetical protein